MANEIFTHAVRDNTVESGFSIEPPPPCDELCDRDSKIDQIKDEVLTTIRTQMPLKTLFRPELKIDLGVFINTQMLIRKIAVFLAPLTTAGLVDKESVSKYFEKSCLLEEIKSLFSQDPSAYLTLLYEACSDVLSKKPFSKDLKSAIEGRIFTVKNALIAQQSPNLIAKSQSQCKITVQCAPDIKKEGELFLRESLRIHIVKEIRNSTFKEGLLSVAEQLIPFVSTITKIYLLENEKDCSNDPLSFRNPTGYNHHGLVAATIMEVCLASLGYTTRVMCRSDLEPKVTLSTAHSIVEVTALDKSKYFVDPCYIQFHKDVCIDDTMLPKASVLVLKEDEVDTYIETTIMVLWKKNAEAIARGDKLIYRKLSQQDQLLSVIIDKIGLPAEFTPSNPENWVRCAFKRVWDVRTYTPVLSNAGFQEIFTEKTASKTHEYVKAMGFASLNLHISTEEVEKRLEKLLLSGELKGQNSSEALSLISQLPTVKRTPYSSLLGVDPRVKEIGGVLNAYFCALRKIVNPEGKDLSVVYGCSGADCLTVMLATDAKDFTFVDLTAISYSKFQRALAELNGADFFSKIGIREKLEQSHGFLSGQLRNGGAMSFYADGKHTMEDIALKFFFDLRAVGVNLNEVVLSREGTEVRVEFPWKYYESFSPRKRSVTFVTADITKPECYPLYLQARLQSKIDIFYMKAAFLAPQYYPQFLPQIAECIREGGWLMTADKTCLMETVTPEACLERNGLKFVLQESKEIKVLEELMISPFDPLVTIPLLQYFPPGKRAHRTVGSDMTYWAILNLRKKAIHMREIILTQ